MLAGENIGELGDRPCIYSPSFPIQTLSIHYICTVLECLLNSSKFLHVWIDFSKVSPRQCFVLYGKQIQLKIF